MRDVGFGMKTKDFSRFVTICSANIPARARQLESTVGRATRPDVDSQFVHPALPGGPLHAEYACRSLGAAHYPVRRIQGIEDVIALGVLQSLQLPGYARLRAALKVGER